MIHHAPPGYDCPFCRIARLESRPEDLTIRTDLVYHNETVTAFLGARQWHNNPGNVLVIPNRHDENLYEIPIFLAARVLELVQAIARALKVVYECDGVSIRQHNEPAGNQDVWHYHMHVTPRFSDDLFYEGLTTQGSWMPEQERAVHAGRLREALAGWQPARQLLPLSEKDRSGWS